MSLDVDPSAAGSPGFDASDLDGFESLSGAERDDTFMDLEREIRAKQAVQALRAFRVGRSASHFDDGHRTAKIWHQRVTNCSGATSAHQLAVGRMLAALPVIAEAALAGDLGADQLRQLSRLYANPRARDQLPGLWETELLRHARTQVLSDFEKICQRWERNADPDGAKQRHEVARMNRCARRSIVGESSEITIRGDALSGEICWDAIEAHAEAEYCTDVERRAAMYGDDADNHPLARTHAQRLHDAFVAICLKSRGTPADTTDIDGTDDTTAPATVASACPIPTTDPLVVIHTTPEFALAALLEYFGFDPTTYLDIATRMSKSQRLYFCETAGGAQIDPSTLAVAMLCGQIQRIVTDPKGHTINLGRKSRLFTGAARDAALLNDDRCSNCGARHRGIQIDHLLEWEDLGCSDQDNAGPNCGWCNRQKHRLKIAVRRDESGWHYYRADGTEIAPRCRPKPNPPDPP